MDDARRVDIFQAAQQLVHKVLFVLARDAVIEADHIMEIGIHVVGHDVELVELLRVTGQD